MQETSAGEDQSFPFLSDDTKLVFKRISTIEDLQQMLNLMQDSCEIKKGKHDDQILEILRKFGYQRPERFLGEELFSVCEEDDEQTLSIKMMIIIYFDEAHEFSANSKFYYSFLCYLEEVILPEITMVAKELKHKAKQVELFQTGVKNLEKWKLIILHFYTQILIHKITLNDYTGLKEYFGNSDFIMLVTLMYLCEKKGNFYKLNPGKIWSETIEQELLLDQMVYWNSLLDFSYFRKPKAIGDNIPFSTYLKNSISMYRQTLICCIYCVAENMEHDQITDKARKIISEFICRCKGNQVVSCMKNDLIDVKELDDLEIISNEKSRNCGKYVWHVKMKLLQTIQYITLSKEIKHKEPQVKFVLKFRKLLLDNMQKDGYNLNATTLQEEAINTSLAVLLLTDNCFGFPAEFYALTDEIFEIWKTCFSSSNYDSRNGLLINRILVTFFKAEYCPCDILYEIIKKCRKSTTNFMNYSNLLNLALETKSLEGMEPQLRSKIKELIWKLSDRITTEYLDDTYITKWYQIVVTSYKIIHENENVKRFLSNIKEKMEEIFEIGLTTQKSDLVYLYTATIMKIVRRTDLEVLLRVFDELDYYPFLTKLLRELITSVNIEDPLTKILAKLVGLLIENGLANNSPFNVNRTEEEGKNLVHDFILPNVIRLISTTNTNLLSEDLYSTNYKELYWILLQSIAFDITQSNSWEGRTVSLLDTLYEKIVKDIDDCLSRYKSRILPTNILYVMLTVFILYIRNNLKLAPLIVKYLFIISNTPDEIVLQPSEYLALLQVVEYLIDNELIPFEEIESGWAKLFNTIPFCRILEIEFRRIVKKADILLNTLF